MKTKEKATLSTSKTRGFRLNSSTDKALQALADKSGKTRTAVLEWLIEQEYRRRIELGQIPSDQDLYDLFGPGGKVAWSGKH